MLEIQMHPQGRVALELADGRAPLVITLGFGGDRTENLLWRLQNEQAPTSRVAAKKEEGDSATYTEFNIEVRAEDTARGPSPGVPWATQR